MLFQSGKTVFLLFALAVAMLLLPVFWFSYPLLGDFLNLSQASGELELDFLDVGQGDATLIKTPLGQNILIDGGPNKGVIQDLAEYLGFWDRTIDLMILTHPHDDHVSGLIDVIGRYNVKQALYTGVTHTGPNYIAWLEMIKQGGIPLTKIDRPQTVELGGGCYLEIIYPYSDLSVNDPDNLNNTSIVAKLVYKETSFVLTGDMESEVEKELLENATELKANVIKVAHHGSDTSSTDDFIKAVKPDFAVISVGADNKFSHPSLRVIERLKRAGAKVFRTDTDGTIVLISDGKNIYLK